MGFLTLHSSPLLLSTEPLAVGLHWSCHPLQLLSAVCRVPPDTASTSSTFGRHQLPPFIPVVFQASSILYLVDSPRSLSRHRLQYPTTVCHLTRMAATFSIPLLKLSQNFQYFIVQASPWLAFLPLGIVSSCREGDLGTTSLRSKNTESYTKFRLLTQLCISRIISVDRHPAIPSSPPQSRNETCVQVAAHLPLVGDIQSSHPPSCQASLVS